MHASYIYYIMHKTIIEAYTDKSNITVSSAFALVKSMVKDWLRDVHSATGYSVSFPVIHDGDFEICKKLGMMPPGGAPDLW